IAHATKLKGGAAGGKDNAVEGSNQAKKPDNDQGMVDPMAAAHHLLYGQGKRRIRSRLTSARIDNTFPSPYPYGRGKGEKAKHHQGQQGGAEANQDIFLGVDGFFRHIGHPFDREKKPNGKGNGGKNTQITVGQGILLQVFPFDLRQTDTGKENQSQHSDNGDQQFKGRRYF